MENNSATDVQIGWSVYTQDGERLGEVRGVRGRYLNVSVPRQPDYWLEMDAIASATDGRVTMSFAKADLGDDYIELRMVKSHP
jgi:hypothetical protein